MGRHGQLSLPAARAGDPATPQPWRQVQGRRGRRAEQQHALRQQPGALLLLLAQRCSSLSVSCTWRRLDASAASAAGGEPCSAKQGVFTSNVASPAAAVAALAATPGRRHCAARRGQAFWDRRLSVTGQACSRGLPPAAPPPCWLRRFRASVNGSCRDCRRIAAFAANPSAAAVRRRTRASGSHTTAATGWGRRPGGQAAAGGRAATRLARLGDGAEG